MRTLPTHRKQFWPAALILSAVVTLGSAACLLQVSMAPFDPTTPAPSTEIPTTAPTSTHVPTQVSPSPTPTREPGEQPVLIPGPSIAYAHVHLTLAGESGSGVSARIEPERNPSPDQDGYGFRHPAYVLLRLIDYPTPVWNSGHPHIWVSPVADYERINPDVIGIAQELETLLVEQPYPLHDRNVGQLPYLSQLAGQTLRANTHYLEFENGRGVRFIVTYRQAPVPVGNDDLWYEFHGITSDGAYYVLARFPIFSSVLPPCSSPKCVPPPGGISFERDDYWQAVTFRLEGMETGFEPSLESLDRIVRTLEIK